MKILVVSHLYPPLNSPASRRVYSWAKYWSEAGHEVAVLTTHKSPWNGSLDLRIEPEVAQRVQATEIPYWPYRGRAGRNGAVNGLAGEAKPNPRNPIWKIKQALSDLRREQTGWLLDPRLFWIGPAARQARKLYRAWPFEVIVSSFGPPASHVIASQVEKATGAFWAADYRDLWHGNFGLHARGVFALLEKAWENHTLKNADLLTSVSDPLCQILASRFGKPVVRVENGFDLEIEAQDSGVDTRKEPGIVEIVYTGTYYPEYNLEPLFAALRLLEQKGYRLEDRLRIRFFSWETHLLARQIEQHAAGKVFELGGYLDHAAALQRQKNADALLFLEWGAAGVDGVLTSKLFEYLNAGKPVLSLGSPEKKAASRLIESTGTGVFLGDSTAEIAAAIEKLLAGEALPYAPRREEIDQYTRKKLAEKMLDGIRQEMARGGRK